jgi:hypothetical protein
MLVGFLGPQPVTLDPNVQTVHANATVTASGSTTTAAVLGTSQVLLIINITNAPTGTLPTLQFSIVEVDPVDLTTPIGTSTVSNSFTAAGYQVLSLQSTQSGAFKVSWTIGGSGGPSFSGVNVSVSGKSGAGSVAANQGLPNTAANGWPVKVTDGTNVLGTGSYPIRVDTTGTTTQPISASSLPLPSGASTSAKQPTLGTAGTPSSDVLTVQGVTSMTPLKVDGSGVTQPVSGTVTAAQATAANLNATVTQGPAGASAWKVDGSAVTQPISAVSLPLPSGAATSAKQPAIGSAGSASSDVLTVQGIASMTALKVDGSGVTQPVSGTFWQATQPVSAASLPLPTGAATETTLGTRLADSTFTGRINTLGQKTMANSTPVVLASDQGALTVSFSGQSIDVTDRAARLLGVTYGSQGQQIKQTGTNYNLASELYAGGTAYDARSIRALTSSDVVTAAQATAANLNATVTQGPAGASAWKVDGSAVTQPVSGTFWQTTQPVSASSLPLPTGASTAAKQPALGTAGSASSDVLTVQGIASMTPLKVDGSGVTQPVSLAAAVDVSDRAGRLLGVVYGSQGQQIKQTATNYNLASELYTGGTAYDARSIRALTSSDVVTAAQSTAASLNATVVQGTGAGAGASWSAQLSDGAAFYVGAKTGQLPAALVGGRLDANVGTWLGSTAPSVGSKTSANSIPVVIASDQGAVPVSGTVTATNASVGATGSAPPASATLSGGSVTTAAPSYTTGQMSALSLNTAGGLRVDGSGVTQPVSGTFWQATQPVSAVSLPLPSGAATAAKQPALGTAGTPSADVLTVQGVASMTALKVDGSAVTQPVSGTFWQATQPVSAASLPLPSGASTAAKQPALGTAGTPSADVLTVQGAASMTALKVDGSGVTQPVSGTVTANVGTTNGLALDATLTGGTQTTRITDGTNTATVKAASTAAVATDKALVVAISPNNSLSIGGASTPSDAFANPTTAMLSQAFLQTWNGSTWDRLRSGASNADGVATVTTGVLQSGALNFGYNGVSWDRLRSATSASDGLATSSGVLTVLAHALGWNGTGWDRLRSSIANGLVVDVSRVQGTVTTTNASIGTINSTQPGSATFVGGRDETTGNMLPVCLGPDGHVAIIEDTLAGFAGQINVWTSDTHTPPATDAYGAQYVRGQVMTDEGSITDDFSTNTLAVALTGTVSFTNNSTSIVGVGTKFLSEFNYYSLVKKSSDAETLWAAVSNVLDDTHATLASAYQGTTQSGQAAVTSIWQTSTGASGGAGVAVASSAVTITSGTAAVKTGFYMVGDYLPFIGSMRATLSQRIANQVAFVGFFDNIATPGLTAGFLFDGTTNTTVKCQTSSTSSANDTQTTTVTLPGGANTGSANVYQVIPRQGNVAFLINGYQVAVHTQHVVPPYADISFGAYMSNAGTVASGTLAIDLAVLESIDRLDVQPWNSNPDICQVTASGRTTTTGVALPLPLIPASTAVAATDPALSVALNPNSNLVKSRPGPTATTAVTQVASSASNVTLKAANVDRYGLTVHNDSTQVLYLKLGATASSTSYTVRMIAQSYYEVPYGYTGRVDGIWASANGNAYVTEVTL